MIQTPDSISPSHKAKRLYGYATFFAILLLLTLPRFVSLNSSVNPDEAKWLARSGHFYNALRRGDFWNIFHSAQPGVTVMWAGAAAFMWRYPAYTQEMSDSQKEIESFLLASGHEPLDLLIAGRFFVVMMNTVILIAAFLAARRLLGWWVASVAFLLIAFDPFHIALSRMLDLDGLLANLLFLSLLTFLNYLTTQKLCRLNRGERRLDLIYSGVAAGLGCLTKASALFLIPFMALTLLARSDEEDYASGTSKSRKIKILISWLLIALGSSLLFCPTLFVNPIDTIGTLFFPFTIGSDGNDYIMPREDYNFSGAEDYGFFFYPLTYLWRTTPIVMLGLLFAFLAYLKRLPPFNHEKTDYITTVLVMFALLFGLFVGLGDIKTDRYLIPSYLPLDLVAGLGWIAVGQAFATRFNKERLAKAIPIAGIMMQGFIILTIFPHLMSYYNPLFGGGSLVPKTIVGWGEGLDEAAYYLNHKPQAEKLRVLPLYHEASFSYFFKGQPVSYSFDGIYGLSNWFKTDYIIHYIQKPDWVDKQLLEYLAQQRAEKVIQRHGIEYAQIYDVRHLLPPAFLRQDGQARFTDWGGAIRLLAYDLPSDPLKAGDSFQISFHLENLAPLDKNLAVLVRVIDQYGNELLRDEGWPYGSPTSEWKLHEIWRDGHDFTIPANAQPDYYQIGLNFYDPKTLEALSATHTLTGESLRDELLVDYLYVGQLPTPPTDTLSIELGADIRFLGAKIGGMDCRGDPCGRPLSANQTLEMQLFWQTQAPVTQDYTIFVHLVGPDGLIAQLDEPPPLPIGLWRPNEFIVDQSMLTIPEQVSPGTYQLRVGMYDPMTIQRLPVSQNGQPIGDYITVGHVRVE